MTTGAFFFPPKSIKTKRTGTAKYEKLKTVEQEAVAKQVIIAYLQPQESCWEPQGTRLGLGDGGGEVSESNRIPAADHLLG